MLYEMAGDGCLDLKQESVIEFSVGVVSWGFACCVCDSLASTAVAYSLELFAAEISSHSSYG